MNTTTMNTTVAMVATDCACCGQALQDAVSVELGIGPVCRKKHGFAAPDAGTVADWDTALAAVERMPAAEAQRVLDVVHGDADVRRVANVLVHLVAVHQGGPAVAHAVAALRALGFLKLADRIARHVAKIVVTVEGDTLAVASPYSDASTHEFRQVPGRRFDGATKRNVFPAHARAAVWKALRRCYAGQMGIGPAGLFMIA